MAASTGKAAWRLSAVTLRDMAGRFLDFGCTPAQMRFRWLCPMGGIGEWDGLHALLDLRVNVVG